jgi:hypothetical protein
MEILHNVLTYYDPCQGCRDQTWRYRTTFSCSMILTKLMKLSFDRKFLKFIKIIIYLEIRIVA